MKKFLTYFLLCLLVISCKKDIPEVKTLPTPEIVVIKIDSTAILDSIARVDSIARLDSITKVIERNKAVAAKKKASTKRAPKIVSKDESAYKSLIFNVQLGINPKRKNWVLFQNGTYIVFPDGYTKDQMKNAAIKLIKSFNNNALNVQKSNFAKGWIVSTSAGIYNYVSKNQIRKGITDFKEVSVRAEKNIIKDKSEAVVVHINTK